MTKKFTFKTEKVTGSQLWRIGRVPTHHIKLDGKRVGVISHEAPHKIRLTIIKKDIMEDKCPNCPWKWITLKHEASSLEEQKEWLNANFDKITGQFTLHQLD